MEFSGRSGKETKPSGTMARLIGVGPRRLAGRQVAIVCLPLAGFLLATSLLRMPDAYTWVALGAAVVVIFASTVRLSSLIFGWAALLPIWSIGPVSPVVFDAARLVLGLIIVVRAWLSQSRPNRELRSWALPLVVVASLLLPLSWWRGESPIGAITMLASVLLVWGTLWRLDSMWPVLLGFATGAGISAVVLTLTALGVGATEYLVPNANPGFARFTGLGTSAPRVSTEFAAAAMVWWAALDGRICRRSIGVVGVAACLLALLLCGGRAGLAGLAFAALLLLARRWLTSIASLTVLGILATTGLWLSSRSVAFNTVDRLDPNIQYQGGFATGRLGLVNEAWSMLLEAPVFGPGAASFAARYGTGSHFPPLSFGVSGGFLAATIILILTLRLILMTWARSGRGTDALVRAGCLVAAVLIGPALLEPDGPFIGVEMLTLLFAATIAVRRPSSLDPTLSVGAFDSGFPSVRGEPDGARRAPSSSDQTT